MKKQSVRTNTVYSVIKSIASVIFPLITFPYISRILLAENVGKINFGNSIVVYFSLIASLGVTTYAIRECAKAREDKERLSQVSSQIISINICTTIIAYISLAILLIFATPLKAYRELIVIQSSTILFATLGADWLNTAMEDFKYITLRTVFFQIISLVLMFAFVKKPEDYMIYAVIVVVATSGGNVLNIFYRRKYCKTRFTFKMNAKKHFPHIMKLFAMILSQQVFCNCDTTMLGLMHGDRAVGLYSTAVKIYNIVNSLMASITWVVMPKLSYAFAREDYDSINHTLQYALNFILTLGVPCVIGMNLLAPEIIKIAAGPAYADAAHVLGILAITLAISLIWGFVMNIILLPAGIDGVCLKACALAAVFNLVTNAIFIPHVGLVAAAISTACSQVIGLLVCLPHVNERIKLKELVRNTIKAPACGGVLVIIVISLCNLLLTNVWIKVMVALGVSFVVYFMFQIWMGNTLVTGLYDALLKSLKMIKRDRK